REIHIWSSLKHDYVLPFLGYYIEGESNPVPNLVSEWMVNGSLDRYMKLIPRADLETWDLLFKIACGLGYLHSNGVIHSDLKCANILISEDRNPLLCDFGISRLTSTTTTSTDIRGSMPWMARELFVVPQNAAPSKHDERSDIWAFGMVIYVCPLFYCY
ncbi:kinase-like protein, partial [Schizopora paradoxa]